MAPGSGTAEQQAALWGARPRDWAEVQEGMVRPLYEAVLDAIGAGAGTRLLDIGCGAGMAAHLAAERSVDISGFDATEALLDIARERTPAGDFRPGDMETLPFDDDSFDAVVSFNGVQFAGDPVAALREAGRVTVPGGTVAVATWGDPERSDAPALMASYRDFLPAPPPGTPGPFALAAPGALEHFASPAGLQPQRTEVVTTLWHYPDLATALRGLTAAGPATAAIAAGGQEAVYEAVTAGLAPFAAADGGYELSNVFHYVVATAAQPTGA
jgi:ubiquinone/menaquinone biosynthesis C-methylase UbiE